jgi:clan AA aspartic protease
MYSWVTLNEREIDMGTVYTEITLKNALDVAKHREGLIREKDVRSITVTAIVDTGAASLVINEEQCQKLGLRISQERTARVADGRQVYCKVTAPVKVYWKNRQTGCEAMVIPGAKTVLLGAIALEGMDLMVNPVTQELAGVHGETEEYLALRISA